MSEKENLVEEEIIEDEIINKNKDDEENDELDINKNIEKKINTSKMYSDIRNAADSYFIETHNDKSIYNNIGVPILKIVIAFLFVFLLVTFIQDKVNINNKYLDIVGLWQDEYNNYYEIYDKTFEMNAGNSDVPFYEGTITNLIKNDKGYTILIEGIKYNLNNDGTTTYDKPLDIVFKITNYTEDIESAMIANMGTEDFDIVRLDKKSKNNR